MPTVSISPYFNSHHHDDNGRPASGWLVYTYFNRSSQKKDTYKDAQGVSKHENPITLDSRGEYPGGGLFLIEAETYTIILKDPNSESQFTWHDVISGTGGSAPVQTSHTDLTNRNIADQHIIGSITDLPEELADKLSKSETSRQYANGPVTILGSGVFTELNQGSLKVQSDVGLVKLDAPYGTNPTYELSRDAGAKYVKMTPVQIEVSQSGLGKTTIDPGVVNSNNSTFNGYLFPDSVRVTSSTQQALMNFTGVYGYNGTELWNYKKDFIQFLATGREVYISHVYIELKVSATDYIKINRETGVITVCKGSDITSVESDKIKTAEVYANDFFVDNKSIINTWDDWVWAGNGVNPPGSPSPAVLTQVSPNEWHWVFSNNTVMAFTDKQIPHKYKEGTDIYPHIHFTPTVTGTYTGTWTAVFTIWPTTATGTVKQVFTKTASFNKTMTFGQSEKLEFDSPITATGFKISALATIELTLALSAGTGLALLGFDGHYQADRVGSNNASTK